MIKCVIFDLDGTLLDTSGGIIESVRHTIAEMRFPPLTESDLKSFIGPPVQNSFRRCYGSDEETAQKAAEVFRSFYKEKELFNAVPYDGIYDLCSTLKKNSIKMAVATYKREDYALTLLSHFGFDQYCASMHGADNYNIMKKEDVVLTCIRELGANPRECVLVGDTDHDALGARAAGVPFIAVTYGFGYKTRTEALLAGPVGVAEHPREIWENILKKEIL